MRAVFRGSESLSIYYGKGNMKNENVSVMRELSLEEIEAVGGGQTLAEAAAQVVGGAAVGAVYGTIFGGPGGTIAGGFAGLIGGGLAAIGTAISDWKSSPKEVMNHQT